MHIAHNCGGLAAVTVAAAMVAELATPLTGDDEVATLTTCGKNRIMRSPSSNLPPCNASDNSWD